jgi:hypothetical protein
MQVTGLEAVIKDLQPIIDAIAASQRDGHAVPDRNVSVTLPATEGKTLVVSLHAGNQSVMPLREPVPSGLDARQLRLVNGTIHEKSVSRFP